MKVERLSPYFWKSGGAIAPPLLRLCMKLCRCEEELQQVMREMKSYLLYFKDQVLAHLHSTARGNYIGPIEHGLVYM